MAHPSHRFSWIQAAPDWRTLLSAILIVFSFPPWDLSFLIWIALIPWLWALQRASGYRKAFIEGAWLSFFMTLGGFYWIHYVLTQFAGLPFSMGLLGLILFAIIGQPQFYFFALLYQGSKKLMADLEQECRWKYAAAAVVMAFLYTGVDWAVPKLFRDTLGHSLYNAHDLRQSADIGGAFLLTWLIFLTNDIGGTLLRRLIRRQEPSIWPALQMSGPQALIVGLLLGATVIYGHFRNREIDRIMARSRGSEFQLAVVQGNIGDFEKLAAWNGIRAAANQVLESFFSLSDQALKLNPRPQGLIWPETAYPSTFRTPQTTEEFSRDQKLERFVRDRGITLLFGGYDQRDGKDFNAFFFLSPRPRSELLPENDLQIYRKNILLLFGEYIPGADWFPAIRSAFPQVGFFGQGPGPEVFEIPLESRTLRVGPIICYEALFPNYILEATRRGSQLILNITNDSWFGPRGEPHLHLALTVFRSIEARLPQLRATNTGISALILPNGEITQPTPVYQAAILNASVPVIPPVPTVMLAWGDWFGPFALSTALVGWIAYAAVLYRRRRFSPALSPSSENQAGE